MAEAAEREDAGSVPIADETDRNDRLSNGPENTAPYPGPLGPKQDPVFPSLPAGGEAASTQVRDEARWVTVPIARNVFAMAVKPWGLTRSEFIDQTAGNADPNLEGSVASLDQPERARVHAIATDFVKQHVRRLECGYAIKSAHQDFTVGSILVADHWVPRTRLRHAQFQWAITDGHVVELRDVRLPVSHLGHCDVREMPDLSHRTWGDRSALPAFIADVLDFVQVDLPAPLAGIGEIALHTNQVLTLPDITPYLEAAEADQMHDLVLPLGNHKMDGLHGSVRYWPVRDSNEAMFSVLSSLAGEVVSPHLYRRWLTKQAYSWLSLILFLTGGLVLNLSGNLAGVSDPPVELVRYLVAAAAVFFAGSWVFTHRYWRIDR